MARWSRAEWALLAEAWAFLLWSWLALRRWQIPALLERVRAIAAPPARPAPHEPIVRSILRAVNLFPMPMLCLPQSVALARMLARRGQPCTLVIGARPTGDSLEAHAWVEREGRPINSPPDSAATHPVLLREAILSGE